MILVMGHLRLPPQRMVDVRGHARAVIEATREEAGCLLYAFSEDLLEPGLLRIIEQWESWEALKAHANTPHITKWRAALKEVGVLERELAAHETGQARPL